MYPEFFVALAVAGVLLTYANGANDNFKGVATLHGSGVLSYRTALVSATVATWLGSLAALLVAGDWSTHFLARAWWTLRCCLKAPSRSPSPVVQP